MQKAADYMASKGIGMIHSVSGVGFTLDLDVDMENWFAKGTVMDYRLPFMQLEMLHLNRQHVH